MEDNKKYQYNNNTRHQDVINSSLGALILSIAYPFDSFQEKIDAVNEKIKIYNIISEKHIDAYKLFFDKYYEYKLLCNENGLFLELPKITL